MNEKFEQTINEIHQSYRKKNISPNTVSEIVDPDANVKWKNKKKNYLFATRKNLFATRKNLIMKVSCNRYLKKE
eukprot:UN03104